MLTKLYSYGEVQQGRQVELFKAFGKPKSALVNTGRVDTQALAKALALQLQAKG